MVIKNIKAASVQFNHAHGDKEANFYKIRQYIKEAASKDADIIVFPEMCITGYWHVRHLAREEVAALAEPVPSGQSTRELLKLAAEYDINIGAGLIEEGDDGNFYNTYIVAMPDGKIASHRKLHCFINENMSSGSEYTVFEIREGWKVGILICYDNNIIENARITAMKGAQLLLAPHQTGGCETISPGCMGLIDPLLWKNRKENPQAIEAEFRGPKGRGWLMRWLPARAHDNGMFLVFSNGVGLDDNEVRTGNAIILDPYGEILTETWKAGDDMITAELEADRLHNCIGQRWIMARRPELYGMLALQTGKERDTRKLRFEE